MDALACKQLGLYILVHISALVVSDLLFFYSSIFLYPNVLDPSTLKILRIISLIPMHFITKLYHYILAVHSTIAL